MKIYIPVSGPEVEELYPEFARFLSDFNSMEDTSQIQKLLDSKEEFQKFKKITFEVIFSSKTLKKENKKIKELSAKHKFFKTDYIEDYLIVEIVLKDKDREKIYKESSARFLLSRLALIIHLTYATKIDLLPGVIYSAENKYLDKTTFILSSIDYAYEIQLKIKWPKIISLKLNETVGWYISNNLHTDSCSKNKLHRAINSFSYQFSDLHERDTSVLFWTMLGIEALLAEGNTNIINQIKMKTSLILGEPKEFKKRLDKLYNYRSRFIHGNINFPAKFTLDLENFEEEYWDYLLFSTTLLISLIRTLILQNKSEFNFEYTLKAKASS